MGNRIKSIKTAMNGIVMAFKQEKNLKLFTFIGMPIFLVINILNKSTLLEYILFIILSSLVISGELMNTAIEKIVDKFVIQKNEDAKFIKDVSAGAVFILASIFVIIETIIFVF